MHLRRVALLALLAGVFAGAAWGQTQPYGGPPGSQQQYGGQWRQPTDPYDRQRNDDWDRERGPGVEVGFFYDELSPYGEWIRHPYYGWVWFPRHVPARWRPYSRGRWVGSEYGWMWASSEPFGWATYHYGRWAWDPWLGWLWVPGTVWGPAWVAWQHGHGYIGWAPLPPTVGFEFGVGLRLGGFNLRIGIAPRNYAFVEERRFLDSRIEGYIVPEARNVTIINNTTDITNYTVVNDRVINHGVAIERIEQVTGQRAPRLRVVNAPDARAAGVQRDAISVFRPTQNKLKTVTVAPRNNAGLPQAVPQPARADEQPPVPTTSRPPAAVAPGRRGPAPVTIPVAPRTMPAPQQINERQFVREQTELKNRLDKEQRALDQIHRQEMAQAKARADAEEVAQRHAAELKEQQERRQMAAEQLQTRQQIERQAAQATAARAQKPATGPAAKSDKPEREKKDDEQKPPPQSF